VVPKRRGAVPAPFARVVEVGDVGRPVRDGRHFVVLVADDDEDDRGFIRTAVLQANPRTTVRCVSDGRELLDHLRAEGEQMAVGQTESDAPPTTNLVLLDLNMPRMNGIEALGEIRADPSLRSLPVVVLSTSNRDEDVFLSYEVGANSYIPKPSTFAGLVAAMQSLEGYWNRVVSLPTKPALGEGVC